MKTLKREEVSKLEESSSMLSDLVDALFHETSWEARRLVDNAIAAIRAIDVVFESNTDLVAAMNQP